MMRSLMLCAALLLLALATASAEKSRLFLPPFKSSDMEYREICERPGGPCHKFSRIIIGTDHLGKVEERVLQDVIAEAMKLGINAVDTAPIYMHSEYRLGNWMKANHTWKTAGQDCPACPLNVITKGGFPFDKFQDIAPGTYQSRLHGTPAEITPRVLEEITGSLSRVPPERIALYLMHRDDFDASNYVVQNRPQTPVKTILEALSNKELRAKYDMVGVSNWATARINQAQADCKADHKLVRPVANSPYFSLMEMSHDQTIHVGGVQVFHHEMLLPEKDFQPGVKIMSYSPLAGFSLFSKTWDEAKAAAKKLKDDKDWYWSKVYDAIFHDANAARFKKAQEFTAAYNKKHNTDVTLDQMVNAWALAHPRLDYLIIGPRSIEALHRSLHALAIAKTLTPADLDAMYSVTTGGATGTGTTGAGTSTTGHKKSRLNK